MKNPIKLLVILICFTIPACAQTKVGKIENGKFIITYDLNLLRNQAENHLEKQGTKTDMAVFSIEKHKIDGTQTDYYILVGVSDDQSVELATELQLSGNDFFSRLPTVFENSATCVGCPRGCSPRRHADDGIIEWYCSPCTVGTGCKKTEHGH